MRRIAIINQKGGVGKTTTTANLGAALAEQGRRVVLVDMDAQANLSLSFGVEAADGSPTSYSVLVGETPFAQALRTTSVPNLSLVASHIDLSGAEMELASQIGREFLLRDALEQWVTDERARTGRAPADYVLFDCPPSLGLLSINALASAGEVLITLQTEFLALQGMSKLVGVVQLLRKRLNPELVVTGILPCLYESRLRLAREVLGEIRKYFPGQVLPVPIRANVKLAEAPSFGQTIFQYAPESIGAMDYRCAAREMLRMETRDPDLAGLPPFREAVLAGTTYAERATDKAAHAVVQPAVAVVASTAPNAATNAAPNAPTPVAKQPRQKAPRAVTPLAPEPVHAKPAVTVSAPRAAAPVASSAAASATPRATVSVTPHTAVSVTSSATKPSAPAPVAEPRAAAPSAPVAARKLASAQKPAPAAPSSPPSAAKAPPTEKRARRAPPVAARAITSPAPKPVPAPAPAPVKRAAPKPARSPRAAPSPAASAPAPLVAPAPAATTAPSAPVASTKTQPAPSPAAPKKKRAPAVTITPAAPPTPKRGASATPRSAAPASATPVPSPSASPAPARDEARALRADDLPPLPPDAFEILASFGLDP